ncbi:MAG: hypothetical protein K2P49_04605 [Oscillospiraceae bacterium]|nr:hypothetical protein [Oscillospiraceae bacterium]
MLSGISGMTPYASYGVYGAGYSSRALQPQGSDRAQSAQRPTELWTARKTAQPELPVQPVTQARPVGSQEDPARLALLRQGSDPVEMAVRMRIQYPNDPTRQAGAAQAAGADRAQIPEALGLKDAAGGQKEAAPALEDAKSAREVMEEGECQTCKERKYQDGSDDPGVSFKTPTNIAPEQAASAVRGHENEHVVREQAEARRENRKVVSQSVTYHTSICPECGKAYVSGGTTRTVTKAGESQQADQQSQQQDPRTPFSAVA